MDSYQVIARKYRPRTFNEVIGQDAIVQTLLHAINKGRVAHAYLFSGLRGTGKTTLARLCAKALNCEARTPKGEPCNRCTSCLEIASGRSLDVIEIDGASNRGIDDIRQLTESVAYTPSKGQYKIYIIDEVHMLTKEASNALLKTLEEPPPKVKFFFATTEPHKILPTILSRCQRFDLGRISQPMMVAALGKIAGDFDVTISEGALATIARLSEGSLRDAQSLLDQVLISCTGPITEETLSHLIGMPSKEPFFDLDRAILSHNLSSAFTLASQVFEKGIDLGYFLEELADHFRTLLLYKMKGKEPTLSPLLEEAYTKESALFSQEHLLFMLDYLVKWLGQLQKSAPKRFELEMVLLYLIRSQKRVSVEQLFAQLSQLEQRLAAQPAEAMKLKESPQAEKEPPEAPTDEKPEELPPAPLELISPISAVEGAHETPQKSFEEDRTEVIAVAVQNPIEASVEEELNPIAACIEENLNPVAAIVEDDPMESLDTPLNEPERTLFFEDEEPVPPIGLVPTQLDLPLHETAPLPKAPEKSQQEDLFAPPAPELKAPAPASSSLKPVDIHEQTRIETLLRFAAVELNGTLHKEFS